MAALFKIVGIDHVVLRAADRIRGLLFGLAFTKLSLNDSTARPEAVDNSAPGRPDAA